MEKLSVVTTQDIIHNQSFQIVIIGKMYPEGNITQTQKDKFLCWYNSYYFLIVFSGTNNQRSEMECHQQDRKLLKKDTENIHKGTEWDSLTNKWSWIQRDCWPHWGLEDVSPINPDLCVLEGFDLFFLELNLIFHNFMRMYIIYSN